MTRSARTGSELLRDGTSMLRNSGSESPGLDAEILLREALQVTRDQLFRMLPDTVDTDNEHRFRELLEQRARGIPVAYIIGRRAFYEHDFLVNEHVLIPRPETETLVEAGLDWLSRHGNEQRTIVDVGTGSGAIAISVALATDNTHTVFASDVSSEAIDVARMNAETLGADIELIEGSLLNWLETPVDLILANLPYLRPDQAHAGIEHEPGVALYAGNDGFALNRALLEQAPSRLGIPGALIMELDPGQAEVAISAAREHFPHASVEIKADLAGTDRLLVITQP